MPDTLVFSVGDGLQLTASAWGNPDNPKAILLHGGGQTRHAWKSTGQHLEEMGYYALAFDLRGHGDSSWSPDGIYGAGELTGDILSIIDQLEGPIVLIGASLGGLISIRCAALRKDRITKLVLVDIVLRPNPEGTERIVEFMKAHQEGFASLDEAADAVAGYLQHRERPDDTSGLEKNLTRKDDGRYYWHWDPRLLDKVMVKADRADEVKQDTETLAQDLDLPVLVVRGDKSDLLDDEAVEHFLQIIPHAEVADVRDASNMVAGDSNARFNQAIFDFLT